jgi:hypothetical protein
MSYDTGGITLITGMDMMLKILEATELNIQY